MASVVSRTSARRTWGPATKAMAPIQGTRDMSGLSALTSLDRGLTGYGSGHPPPETLDALAEQGMLTGGAFSPGRPIQQFAPYGMDPRGWDFPIGVNVTTKPRAQTGRVSFDTLKSLIDNWDVARLCITHIQKDIRSMDWNIVPKKGLEKDEPEAIKAATAMMEKPDGRQPFDSWQWQFLEDVLRFDAGTLHRRRRRDGKPIGLEVVSGVTIAPLIDYYGRLPEPPAPGYVQYISGIPWEWLGADTLVYQPFQPLPESPYGLPVMEWLMLTGNTDLRFQWHFLQYFTEGSVPDGFMEAPPDASDPENIVKFQAAWDAVMEGDAAQKHKIRWIPADSKPTFPGHKQFDPQFPLYLIRKCCAAFGITPNDIGITDAVNKASADSQMDVQFRIGTMPLVRYLEGIYSRYLQEDHGLPVEFKFDTGREKEDRLQEAQAHDFYVKMGAESPDEVRANVLGLPVDVENPVPRFVFSPRAGAIPVKSIIEIAGQIDPATAAPEAGSVDTIDTAGQFVTPTATLPQPDDTRTKTAASKAPGQDPATEGATSAAQDRAPGGKNSAPAVASDSNEQAAQGVGGQVKKGALKAAGLAVKADDTGRVLMLQRALSDDDPAGGKWEWPGGHLEVGEDPLEAAKREWGEETGAELPDGAVAATWTSPDGVYQGFVYVIACEADLDINLDHEDREVLNPDDPDGDAIEVVAWWDPAAAHAMPGLRPECSSTDWGALATAVKKSRTARWRASKKARRREVEAATDPFAKAVHERPGHEQLTRAEDHYADRLQSALGIGLDPAAIAEGWVRMHPPAGIAKAEGDVPSEAWSYVQGLPVDTTTLLEILRALYGDGYVAGTVLGHQALDVAGIERALHDAFDRQVAGLDWSKWQPGHAQAAAELAGTDGGRGLRALLDEAGVTIQGVSDTALERIASILAEGAEKGSSVDAIGRLLREFAEDPGRARMIANTELARAVSTASLDTYRFNGITGKSWLTFNPCPICQRNAAAGVIPLRQAFPSGADAPPQHPHCKCAIAPGSLGA